MAIERTNPINAKMFIYISHILPHINAGRIWICSTTLALVRADGEGWYAYQDLTGLAEEFSQGKKNGKQEAKILYTKLAEKANNKLQDATYFVYGSFPPDNKAQLSTENANFVLGLALRKLDELKKQ